MVSAGDGALAVAWEATTTSPTTVGEIDGYVVQHRRLKDAVVLTATDGSQSFEADAWTDWTSADKTASDRSHVFTGLPNGEYQVRVKARSSGDDDDASTTDIPRYGLFYHQPAAVDGSAG